MAAAERRFSEKRPGDALCFKGSGDIDRKTILFRGLVWAAELFYASHNARAAHARKAANEPNLSGRMPGSEKKRRGRAEDAKITFTKQHKTRRR